MHSPHPPQNSPHSGYPPPGTPDDSDLAAAVPGLVTAASALTSLASLFLTLTGAQYLDVTWRTPWREYLVYGLLLMFPIGLFFALRLYRGKFGGAFAALGWNGVVGLFAAFWLFGNGAGFSLMNLCAGGMALIAGLVCLFAIGPAARFAKARKALLEQGIDLGL